jgi:hypothetical protein
MHFINVGFCISTLAEEKEVTECIKLDNNCPCPINIIDNKMTAGKKYLILYVRRRARFW